MKNLIIDNKNWQVGSSTDDGSDFDGIAGLSPDYKGQNYYASKGDALAGQPSLVTMSGYLAGGSIIAAIVDPSIGGKDALFVTSLGNFFYSDGLTFSSFLDDSAHSTEYRKGKTDLKYFKGSFYATRNTDIVKFETNLSTKDLTWWTVTKAKAALNSTGPHPMEIVEDTLYIADLNEIHTWDGITAVKGQFALPTGYIITTIKVHPDGRYLKVFATDTINMDHSDQVESKMYLLDTTTLEFINEYDLTEQVEGAINLGGTTFLTFGDNFGYFDGSGLKTLRKIEYVGNSLTPLFTPYLSTFGQTIIIPSTHYVMAYGDVSGKGNIFFYPLSIISDNFINFIYPITNKYWLVQYQDAGGGQSLARVDMNSYRNISGQTTKIDPGAKIWIRKLKIFTDALPANCYVQIYIRKADGTTTEIGVLDYASDGNIKSKDFFCNVLADFIQPFILGDYAPLIKKIHLQYESAE